MNRLALNMVVYNEADKIEGTLTKILPHVDEAIVVDQSSTDGTADICLAMGVTVLQDLHHGFPEPSRNLALAHTEADWVLTLDADEEMTDEFVENLRIMDQHAQVRVRIGLKVAGEVFGAGGPLYRIFKKDDFYFVPRIHTCALPKRAMSPSMGLHITPYVAIWNVKTWASLLAGFERWEALGAYGTPLGGFLHMARSLNLCGEDLDAMSRYERHKLGFSPEKGALGGLDRVRY